jgi:hypothetical protein
MDANFAKNSAAASALSTGLSGQMESPLLQAIACLAGNLSFEHRDKGYPCRAPRTSLTAAESTQFGFELNSSRGRAPPR